MKEIIKVNIESPSKGKNTVGFAYKVSDDTYRIKTIYEVCEMRKSEIHAFFHETKRVLIPKF